ncbi:purine nucleoside phosphorylase LACC1-like isoform X1 [Haliotis rubra]|uniref:purine nucleoside phosphorylase LACC1-like isoform X1 n=2 Tax=Haliotis rubra TaxID=36100 RepID=UPI001EE5DD6B|nr:purine nucleoside phosphorylase LACC1-like isoform X1 [Haliotis rubra]
MVAEQDPVTDMEVAAPSAVIVDIHGVEDNVDVLKQTVNHLLVMENVSSPLYVYFLTSTETLDVPINGLTGASMTTSMVVGEGRVDCFYDAKRKLDNVEVVNVCVLCCEPCEEYWKSVCGAIFTPVHTWRIETTTCDVTVLVDAKSALPDLRKMLETLPSIGDVNVLKTTLIPSDTFNHGYSTRCGGITSIPSLASLNLLYTPRKRDSRLTVAENLRRLARTARFDPDQFHVTRTNHANKVWVVGKEQSEKYDAIVTDKPGVTVAAAGADCTPLLFVDPVKRVCGAAHAGYLGTLKRVVVETVNALVEEFGSNVKDILVTMGPTLCSNCFSFDRTDPAVEEFLAIDQTTVDFRVNGEGTRVHAGLVTTNTLLLERMGIKPNNIDTSRATCTACDPDRFFSFQRDRFPFGNQVGFVSIR